MTKIYLKILMKVTFFFNLCILTFHSLKDLENKFRVEVV